MVTHSRREVLAGIGSAAGIGLAGCSSNEPSGDPSGDTNGDPTSGENEEPENSTQQTSTDQSGSPGVAGTLVTRLTAADSDSYDLFGSKIAVSDDGSVAVVSAQFDDDPNGESAGSAYIFEQADGNWSQRTKLAPENGAPYDEFGDAVALSGDGDVAVLGAPGHQDDTGVAYVFTASGGTWSQQTMILAEDSTLRDEFGRSVAVAEDGTVVLVGAPYAKAANGTKMGAAYVFEESGDGWNQRTKLGPGNGESGDKYGASVSLSSDGTAAVIGAPSTNTGNGGLVGAAYVFEQSADGWHQQTRLNGSDVAPRDQFGTAVTVSGDGTTAIVGAPNDKRNTNGGSAYVFGRSGGWQQQAMLTVDGMSGAKLGTSIATSRDGSAVLLGAIGFQDRTGVAHVFNRSDETWERRTKLQPDDLKTDDEFSSGLAMTSSGSTALVGAQSEDTSGGSVAGSVYVFN